MARKSNILLIFSTVGVAATAIITYKKSEKIRDSIEKVKQASFKDSDANTELVKNLAPPVIAGAATVACTFLYGHLTGKQIAALTAAGAAGVKYMSRYRQKVRERFGKEADREIVTEIAKEDWAIYPNLPEPSSEEEELFYDDMGHKYFYAKPSRVEQAMYHINRNLTIRGEAFLEEFYDFIGIDCPIECKNKFWDYSFFTEELGVMPWIDFYGGSKELQDGRTAKIIGVDWDPIEQRDDP